MSGHFDTPQNVMPSGFFAGLPVDQCTAGITLTDGINQVLDLISGPDDVALNLRYCDVPRLEFVDDRGDRFLAGD